MVLPSKTIGWAIVAIVGLLLFIFQLLTPDLVPNAINSILSDNTSIKFVGIKPLLHLTLIVYQVFGFALFFSGTILSFISYNRDK